MVLLIFLILALILLFSVEIFCNNYNDEVKKNEQDKEVFNTYMKCKNKIEKLKNQISEEEYNLYVEKFNSIKDFNKKEVELLNYNLDLKLEQLKHGDIKINKRKLYPKDFVLAMTTMELTQNDVDINDEKLKKQYHILVKKYHPDKVLDENEKLINQQKLVEINKAKEYLTEYIKNNK